jgi:hypothetical protein
VYRRQRYPSIGSGGSSLIPQPRIFHQCTHGEDIHPLAWGGSFLFPQARIFPPVYREQRFIFFFLFVCVGWVPDPTSHFPPDLIFYVNLVAIVHQLAGGAALSFHNPGYFHQCTHGEDIYPLAGGAALSFHNAGYFHQCTDGEDIHPLARGSSLIPQPRIFPAVYSGKRYPPIGSGGSSFIPQLRIFPPVYRGQRYPPIGSGGQLSNHHN